MNGIALHEPFRRPISGAIGDRLFKGFFVVVEEWKTFPLDDQYEVSSHGRVRHISTQYIKKQRKNKDGYALVSLRKYSPTNLRLVSRMVAYTFLGISDLVVDHIDNNKENNHLSNLQYLTNVENLKKSFIDNPRPNVILRKDSARNKRWEARFYRDGVNKSGGCFETKGEAIEAWKAMFDEYNKNNPWRKQNDE